MTLDELRQLAAQVGFPDPNLAAAVAEAESRGVPTSTNIVTAAQASAWNAAHPGEPRHGPERSFGLWQINTLAWPAYDETSLLDPTYNAQAALAVSRGGTYWKPWATYTSGLYLKWYSSGSSPVATSFPWGAVLGGLAVVAVGGTIAYTVERGRPPRFLRRVLG